MLQMLWSRGFSSSSKSTSSSCPQSTLQNPPPIPSSSAAIGPTRPLRFVYCDDEGKLHLDPEGVAALRLIKGPTAIVSVCGRARQGKSFLLNQLLGRSGGFQVASTHQPCTKGLWIWSAPLKQIALDGTEYHLLFLDSEGIDACDQTKTYCTQIFTLAVALSSMFIYNQMGGIDEAALDHLSLVTEVTKHIHVKAGGERATASEIARFSPVFIWLLRDFYLDLSEDNRKIAPRDYLEIALSPTQGGKDLSAKNEIRESIRALFPDRECFVLVRPLNNESDLQRLDQFSLDDLRPEFRAGLNALKKYVLERTKPKQVGAMIMTGPLLAGVTKSFLDAINNGTVPEISTSLLNVEERECRRAYESATELYVFSFDRTKPLEEAVLREVHDIAVQKSLAAFSSGAVGSGSSRQKYEKLLQIFFKKAFEDYKRDAFLKANLRCSDAIRNMENKLQEVCNATNVKLEDAVKVLDGLIVKYEKASESPGKWQMLATFLRQSFQGPIYKLVKKQWDQIEYEKTTLTLKCHLSEEKLRSLEKQLEEVEKYKADCLRNNEKAINDKNKVIDDYSWQMSNLEEKYVNAVKALDAVKLESSEWKRKYQQSYLKQKAEEELARAEIATLRSRSSAAEASLAFAQEQAMIVQAEASDWRQKYDKAVIEDKTALERATRIQEHSKEHAKKREEALRAEFLIIMTEKEEATKKKQIEIKALEDHMASSRSELKDMELKLEKHDWETLTLKHEIKELQKKLCCADATAQLHQEEAQKLLQEKRHLERHYQFDSQRLQYGESDKTFKSEAGTEPEQSTAGVNISHIEKSNAHDKSTMEGARQTEGVGRHAAILERGETTGPVCAVEMLRNAAASDEMAWSPDHLLEVRKANLDVDASPSQLQCPQGRLDNLEQKLITSVRPNMETKLLTNGAKDSPSFQKCNSRAFSSSLSTLPVNWFHGRFGPSYRPVRAYIQQGSGHVALSRAKGCRTGFSTIG